MTEPANAPPGPPAAGPLSGALTVSGLTAASRVVGLGRQLVFQAVVGATLLGTVYTTANTLPNIVFEIVVGGALAGSVVPLLAGAADRQERGLAHSLAGALLGWTLAILVPLTVAAMVAAPVLARALLGPDADADAAAMTTRMLLVFLPQVPMYGVAVVTGAALNSHRRFAAAALAPLVSSLVLIGAFFAFGVVYGGSREDLGAIPISAELVLSGGTTLAVLALMLTTALPAVRAGIIGRPGLRFPTGAVRRVLPLALAGLGLVAAQQVTLLVVIRVANTQGGPGALVTWQYAFLVMMLPFAVLAYPVATAAFPSMAAAAEAGEHIRFAEVTSLALRTVVVAGALGAGALVAVAAAVARFFGLLGETPTTTDYPELSAALVLIAPAVLGTGLVLMLTRALMSVGRPGSAVVGTATGWLAAAGAGVALAAGVTDVGTVAVLSGAVAGGLLLGSAVLAVLLALAAGTAALRGAGRSLLAGVVGAGLGGGLGTWAAGWLLAEDPGLVGTALASAVGGILALGVGAGVVWVLDRAAVRVLLRRGSAAV